jgi:HK97 family phage portal protein
MDLISRLSALPVKQYRRAAGAPVEVERPSPLLSAPWVHMHAIGWRRQVLMSWLTAGNVFGLVAARDRLGYPVQMEILSPSRMSARPVGVGSVQWLLDGRPVGDDLVHWPAFTVPGSPIGLSPLQYAASMTGLGLSAGEFGRRWFSDGAHPSAVLSTDQPVTQDQAATIKERFRAAVSGREPVVLGLGVTYEAIQVSPEESQFLETIKANKADIAGFFLVPPEMIGGESGNSQTYANVEQRSLNYLTYNAGWWVTLMEEFVSSMVPPSEYVKVNTGALVKVDVKTQAEVETLRIRGGWGTPDEAREHEDRPPLPGGVGAQTVALNGPGGSDV